MFDWGGVLSMSPAERLADLEARLGHEPGTLRTLFALTGDDGIPLWIHLESGRLPIDHFAERVAAQAHELLGEQPLDLEEFVAFDWLYHAGVHWPVVHHIRDLRAAGYRLGMLTNNVAEWREAWRSTIPVAELFDDVVDSSEVGICKPDARIYHLACERLGVEPAHAVFLDDTERNVDGARAVGMRAILVGPDPGVALAELDRLLAEEGAPRLPNQGA